MVPEATAARVAVIGAGVTGLTAAHRIAAAGGLPVVIDRSAALGGKVVTENSDGFVVEGGPDAFVAGKGAVLDLAGELGIADRVIYPRPEYQGSYVLWGDRLHPLPAGLMLMAPGRLGPFLRSSLLSWPGKLRALADLVIPRGQPSDDESLESFVTRRLGGQILDRIAEPLVAGIHATRPPEMSLRAAFPRFLEMERTHRSIILAARALRTRGGPTPPTHFASFAGGMGELSDALVKALPGHDIRTGVAVTALEDEDGAYRVSLADGDEIVVTGVVLALPASDAAALLSRIAPDAASAFAGIGQVSTATVTMGYRAADVPNLPGTGFVVPAAAGRALKGVTFASQKWEGRVPDQDHVLVRAHVGDTGHDDDTLTAIARAELRSILGLDADPVLTRGHRWEGGLHSYTLGHLERVATIEEGIASHPGLAVAGSALHGVGLNECIVSGRAAADRVMSAFLR